MLLITREGMLKGLGICVLVLGFLILANIAQLTLIYVDYYPILENSLAEDIGLIWLRLVFEPISGAVIGLTLCSTGLGIIRLRRWSWTMSIILMYLNFFNLGCWVYFTDFTYISREQFVQVLAMYILLTTLLNLKWIRNSFA